MAGKSLEADLKRAPNNVLLIFGDAIKISPNCLRGLFRTAIKTARPDEGLLQQMIQIGLNEYPEEANAIAEVCMEEAPDKADTIKAAFVSAPKPKREGSNSGGTSMSPVDRFLQNQKPIESAEKSVNYDEADRKIQEAIAKMTAKIEGKSAIIPTPKITLPNALVEEKITSGKLPDPGGERIGSSHAYQKKTNSDQQIGSQIKGATFKVPNPLTVFDKTSELKSPSPIISDSRSETSKDTDKFQIDKKPDPSAETVTATKASTWSSLRPMNQPSSVYYISPAIETRTEQKLPSSEFKDRIILRSNPVSPTSPR